MLSSQENLDSADLILDTSLRHCSGVAQVYHVSPRHTCHFWESVSCMSVSRDQTPIIAPSQHVSLTEVTLSSPFSHRHVSMQQSQSSLSLMDVIEPYSNILMHTISQEPPKPPHINPAPPQTHTNPHNVVPAKSCLASRQQCLAGSHL